MWFGCGGRLIDTWVDTWGRGFRCCASDLGFGFEIATRATIPWLRPLPQRSVFFTTSDNGRRSPGEGFDFSFRFGCQWGYHRVWIVCSSITFVDFSRVDLIFISRYFSFVLSCNPVYVSHVDSSTLVFSLSSHRPSFISLIFSARFLDS